ncbi:hypothetical protein [Gulosibacter molinativorax]|nr:hypothetical protein [Gulosibacter molinativorax]QUY60885.1 Hypotetical protein [Gulosibacter molinativorax]
MNKYIVYTETGEVRAEASTHSIHDGHLHLEDDNGTTALFAAYSWTHFVVQRERTVSGIQERVKKLEVNLPAVADTIDFGTLTIREGGSVKVARSDEIRETLAAPLSGNINTTGQFKHAVEIASNGHTVAVTGDGYLHGFSDAIAEAKAAGLEIAVNRANGEREIRFHGGGRILFRPASEFRGVTVEVAYLIGKWDQDVADTIAPCFGNRPKRIGVLL